VCYVDCPGYPTIEPSPSTACFPAGEREYDIVKEKEERCEKYLNDLLRTGGHLAIEKEERQTRWREGPSPSHVGLRMKYRY
jgi:hypothetical protein